MKKFAILVLGIGIGAVVAYGQTVKKIQEVVGSGAADAKSATMHMYGTIGQGIIGPTASAGNVDYQGFWHIPAKRVGIEVTKLPAVPGDFELFQNYPNPFNPTTTIKFSVPSYSHVVLHVISMTGALVKTLVDENYSSGEYSVVFSANELPSGPYLYTLEAGGHMMTKRMILIK